TLHKLIASLAVLGAAAAIAGLGTYATFTSSTSASHTIASGTLSLTSGPTNRLGTGATVVAPGDSMQRAIDLNYAGSISFGSATLTTSASPSTALDTDATDGLHVAIAASALCVCAALASARPLVAQRYHPRLAIVHRALAPVSRLDPGDRAQRTLDLRYIGKGQLSLVVLRVRGLSQVALGAASD